MGYKRRKLTEGCLVNLSYLKFCFLKFSFFLQKTSVAVEGPHYPGNGKFLVSSPSKNTPGFVLWMVENSRTKKIFFDIGKNPILLHLAVIKEMDHWL